MKFAHPKQFLKNQIRDIPDNLEEDWWNWWAFKIYKKIKLEESDPTVHEFESENFSVISYQEL